MLLRPSARLQHAWPTIAERSENQPGAEAGETRGIPSDQKRTGLPQL